MLELLAWAFLVLMLTVVVGACVAAVLMWLAASALREPPPIDQDLDQDEED